MLLGKHAVPLTQSLGALGGKSEGAAWARSGYAGAKGSEGQWFRQAEVMIWALAAAGGVVL